MDTVDKVEIEATVVSGLESMAREEIQEKLLVRADISRGKVWFQIPTEKIKEIVNLRSIDNIFVVVHRIADASSLQEPFNDLTFLYELPATLEWQNGVSTWIKMKEADLGLPTCFAQSFKDASEVTPEDIEKLPKFRVTCNRNGKAHSFTSMQAAAKFGAGINDTFHWKVDMKKFDMNIVLNISWTKLDVLIALSDVSMHHRNLIEFGPTTLRCTIAYNMLRMCRPRPGEIILDPMCGGGSIPLEAAINFPATMTLCADKHELAIPRCKNNLVHNQESCNRVDLLQWDSTNMPLRDGTIDVLVTDLPFGKRMGSKSDNRILYPTLLKAMSRIAVPGTARAVLLTQDRRSLIKAIRQTNRWWKQGYTVTCNVGGLEAIIVICHRTSEPFKANTETAPELDDTANVETDL